MYWDCPKGQTRCFAWVYVAHVQTKVRASKMLPCVNYNPPSLTHGSIFPIIWISWYTDSITRCITVQPALIYISKKSKLDSMSSFLVWSIFGNRLLIFIWSPSKPLDFESGFQMTWAWFTVWKSLIILCFEFAQRCEAVLSLICSRVYICVLSHTCPRGYCLLMPACVHNHERQWQVLGVLWLH